MGGPWEDLGGPWDDLGGPCEDLGMTLEVGRTLEDLGRTLDDLGGPREDLGGPWGTLEDLGGPWRTLGGPPGAPSKHPRGTQATQEAPRSTQEPPRRHQGGQRRLGGKMWQNIHVCLSNLSRPGVSPARERPDPHQVLRLRTTFGDRQGGNQARKDPLAPKKIRQNPYSVNTD